MDNIFSGTNGGESEEIFGHCDVKAPSDPALARSLTPNVIPDMEMRTHHPSKRGSSMEEEDRLSSLPDDLLHSILRELPLKHAVRTSALSRRWAPQWLRALATSRVLDFTDRDFARGQPPARAAATVRRCLELHAEHGAPLDAFRVALVSPPARPSDDGAFQREVAGWIASAVVRGAREVEVDLTPAPAPTPAQGHQVRDFEDDGTAALVELPGDLFVARNSLARLALSGFSLRAVPSALAAGLAGLRSLSLSNAGAADEAAVWDVVSSCPALEHLSLSCFGCWNRSASIRIVSETLRVLEIVRCEPVEEVRITTPALQSIAFHDVMFFLGSADDVAFHLDGDMLALRDVYLSQIPFGHDSDETYYESLLSCVAHAPVWTLSSDAYNLGFRFDTTNIQELQVLMAFADDSDLEGFAGFCQENKLPLLDRLFVRLPDQVTDASDADAAAAAPAGQVVDDIEELEIEDEFVLDSLSFIKLVNFRGTMFELQLLAFVLKRAPALEHIVLVTVGEGGGGAPGPAGEDEHLELIERRVSVMQKASTSPHACLTVCRPSQDRSKNPVHTRIYHE